MRGHNTHFFRFVVLIIVVFILGCVRTYTEENFELDSIQSSLKSSYRLHDVISFVNTSTAKIDSFRIERIDSLEYRTSGLMSVAHKDIEIKANYFPMDIYDSNSKDAQITLLISVKPSMKERLIMINYKHDLGSYYSSRNYSLTKDTLNIMGFKVTNYYIIKSEEPVNYISTILLTPRYGLTAYKSKDGKWSRIYKKNGQIIGNVL